MTFEYRHGISINPVWIPDEDTNDCYCCHGIFTFSIRRHHCRTCGHVVCDSCSKTKQMVNGTKVRICRCCNTYLWIKRSGEDIDNIINLINQCLTNYRLKWQNIKILLNAQSQIIKQIQIQQKNGNYNDNEVVISISTYSLPPTAPNKFNKFNLNHVTLNNIESLLEFERNDNMIYFIAHPPKHNPKLSPWTRRLLLITKDSKIFLSSPLDTSYSLFQFIPNTINNTIKDNVSINYNSIETQEKHNKNTRITNVDSNGNQQQHKFPLPSSYRLGFHSVPEIIDTPCNLIENPPILTHVQPVTYINFQYYAPLNRLFQQQIIPIHQQFLHIPQFKKAKQNTVIIYMTKRNAKPKSLQDIGNNDKNNRKHTKSASNSNLKSNNHRTQSSYSSVLAVNDEKPSNGSITGNLSKNWSYFKDRDVSNETTTTTTNDDDINDEGDEETDIKNDIFANIEPIDTNKTPPTLIMLPFSIQLYPSSYFQAISHPSSPLTKSRRNSSAKLPSKPPPKPPIRPPSPHRGAPPPPSSIINNNNGARKKSLGDVLPEPHKPPQHHRLSVGDTSSPTPPLPPPPKSNNSRPTTPQSPLSGQYQKHSASGSGSSGSRNGDNNEFVAKSVSPISNPLHSSPEDAMGADILDDNTQKIMDKIDGNEQYIGHNGGGERMMDKIDENEDNMDIAGIEEDIDEIIAKYTNNGDDDEEMDNNDGTMNVDYNENVINDNKENNKLAIIANNVNFDAIKDGKNENKDDIVNDIFFSNINGRENRSGAFSEPPTPKKSLVDEDENDIGFECKDNDKNIMDDNDEDIKDKNDENKEETDKIGGFGAMIMSRFFKRQSLKNTPKAIKTDNNDKIKKNKSVPTTPGTQTQSVYTEYINKFSSFFAGDNNENKEDKLNMNIKGMNDENDDKQRPKSPKSPKIFNDSDEEQQEFESDIVVHPQRNMFNEDDWKCLDFIQYDDDKNNDEWFDFDGAQDLYDVLNCHRHRYLRNFYKHIVSFHNIIELMNKSVSWSNKEHVNKLRVLWDNLVIHSEDFKKNPLKFDEMLLIKNGSHKYWKEIGFQGKDPLTDFRGMGEFALNCLEYFALNYSSHCAVIFSKTRSPDNYYPLCASFINIVNLICELTNARKVEELDITQQTALFKLFIYQEIEEENGYKPFEELFCLICRVFDNVWRATKSFYWDFPKLYNAFRERIEFMLSKEPKSLKILMEWLEVDTYIFEYKEADFNKMDSFDSNLILLNGK